MSVFFQRRGAVSSYPKKASDYAIGESAFLEEKGVQTEYLVVHQGNPNASFYDASCEGTWLLRKDLYTEQVWDQGAYNDYRKSDINAYLNSTFLGLFNSKIRNVIKEVKIPCYTGSSNSTMGSGANGLSTKVFLLGCYEVGFTTSTTSGMMADGAKLDYFEAGDTASSAANTKRIALLNDTAAQWWLRTPITTDTGSAWVVAINGSTVTIECHKKKPIRPCIIVPYDTRL